MFFEVGGFPFVFQPQNREHEATRLIGKIAKCTDDNLQFCVSQPLSTRERESGANVKQFASKCCHYLAIEGTVGGREGVNTHGEANVMCVKVKVGVAHRVEQEGREK